MSDHRTDDRPLCAAPAAELLTLSFLLLLFVPTLAFAVALMFKLGALRWQLPAILGLAAPLLCIGFCGTAPARARRIALLLFLALTGLGALLCFLVYDTSYDGLAYQGDAVLSLLHGANPFFGGMTGDARGYDYWTAHYPKASWYFAAVAAHLSGDFQLGKIYNFLLMFAAFFYTFLFLKERRHATRDAWLFAAAAVNPVTLSQLWTYYVDGALGSLLTLLILSTLNLLARPRRADRCVFIMAACLAVNIKFSGAAYVAAFIAVAGFIQIARLIRRRRQALAEGLSLAGDAAIALALALLVLGFDPYVTNTIAEGNPMYPLLGPHAHDIMTSQNPRAFQDSDATRFGELAESIFGRIETLSEPSNPVFVEKWPFSVTATDVLQFRGPAVKIAGWGVLFSGILLMGAMLYVSGRRWRHGETNAGLALTLASTLINPNAWWARYAPQVALLPVFPALAALHSPDRFQRFAARATAVLLLCNSLLIAVPNTLHFEQKTQKLNAEIQYVLALCGPGDYALIGTTPFHYEQFLEPRGIRITQTAAAAARGVSLLPFEDVFLYRRGCGGKR